MTILRFQRNGKTEGENDIYLWYVMNSHNGTEIQQSWLFTTGEDFHDRTAEAFMFVNTEGEWSLINYMLQIYYLNIIELSKLTII